VTEALLQEIRTLKSVFESARDPEGRAFAPLADAYRRAGEIQQAVRLLSEGLARHPNFVPGHVVAARLYAEQGLSEEAQIAARNALDLDAENVSALRSLLRVLEERGEAEAEEVRSRLLTLEPDFVPEEPAPPPPPRRSRATAPPPPADEGVEASWVDEAPAAEPEAVIEAPAPMEAIDLDAMAFDIESLSRGAGGAYALDPEEATPSEDVAPTLVSEFGTTGEEPVVDLEGLAAVSDDEAEETVSLAGLAPEIEPEVELPTTEPVIQLEDLAPVGEDTVEDVVSLADLAPQPETLLPTEEPVIELDDLAPVEVEEPVMDLADLAPEVEEPVMDLADLAPEVEEPIMDLADLAPEVEEPVMDLADLAPEVEEPVMDLADLAPQTDDTDDSAILAAPEPEEPEEAEATVVDLETLAPEEPDVEVTPEEEAEAPEPPEITMLDLAEMTAEVEQKVVIDLDALGSGHAADESEAAEDSGEDAAALEVEEQAASSTTESEGEDDEGVGEPVYTRTLAELYVKQGAFDEALKVYRHLAELSPDDDQIARRIEELESGLLPDEIPHPEETESLARDLAASGDGEHEVESPFAWSEDEAGEPEEERSSIKDYFDGLLNWKPEKHS